MSPVRRRVINGNLIEEYYWTGRFVVYVNHAKSEHTFEEEVARYE